MPIDLAKLQQLRIDHQRVTGKTVEHFRCPITLADEAVELINGHILNEAIPNTSRDSVIARKDVDNHFGSALEAELIAFLELGVQRNAENLLDLSDKIIAVGKDGKEWDVFIPSPGSNPGNRFPAVQLPTAGGHRMGFIKGTVEDVGPNPQIVVQRTTKSLAHVGALLKSAHLCLFNLLGYEWVFSWPGGYVRGPLTQFFVDKAKGADAEKYFRPFSGSCGIRLDAIPDAKDSLSDSLFLLHSSPSGVVFGLTCLFNMNRKLVNVTLPYWYPNSHDTKIRQWSEVLWLYHVYIADKSTPHVTHLAQRKENKWVLAEEPMKTFFEGTLPSSIILEG